MDNTSIVNQRPVCRELSRRRLCLETNIIPVLFCQRSLFRNRGWMTCQGHRSADFTDLQISEQVAAPADGRRSTAFNSRCWLESNGLISMREWRLGAKASFKAGRAAARCARKIGMSATSGAS
jgi:hypothetical protein